MNWIIILTIAYLLNAGSTAINKFLIEKKIPSPAAYAFWVALLSLVAIVLMPFDFQIGTPIQMTIAILSGIFFTLATLYMFKAIDKNEASRISPFIGGWQPIFIFILAWFFLGEKLPIQAVLAFIIILVGTILISHQKKTNNKDHDSKAYWLALLSSVFFALSYVLNKNAFNDLGFFSGLGWSRIGAFIGALLFLLIPTYRHAILKIRQKTKSPAKKLFIVGQIFGALSAFLVFYAIAVSPSVAIINATRGIEYVFLLIIISLISIKHKGMFEEKVTPLIITKKITATILIIAGLFILFI